MRKGQRSDSRYIQHQFLALDTAPVVTSVVFQSEALFTGPSGTVNPIAASAMRLRRVGCHNACGAVNSAGDWTLRIRVNESGSDSATFTLRMEAAPGSKDAGAPSTEIILQAADTYHLLADGPSRNLVVARLYLEWELL